MAVIDSAKGVAELVGVTPELAGWRVLGVVDDAIELTNGSADLVMAWPSMWTEKLRVEPYVARARMGSCILVLLGSDADFDAADVIGKAWFDVVQLVAAPLSLARLVALVRAAAASQVRGVRLNQLQAELSKVSYENELLVSIGRSLAKHHDIDSLLSLILSHARDVTGADAGSVYVVEGTAQHVADRSIRFKVSQNDSIAMIDMGNVTMAVDPTSIVGCCVLGNEAIRIDDLYALDAPGVGNNPWGFIHNRSYDLKTGYQTRSIATLPMVNARGDVIGVIQLINKRRQGLAHIDPSSDFGKQVVPFDDDSIEFATALAAQAGIALENAVLYDDIKTLFEGFVTAAVSAIESRDPTTSGHSNRVANLTTTLAKAADRHDVGKYASLTFTVDDIKQIQYAALLHDFGKVSVRENVLVKAKKLYEHERRVIRNRFKFIRKSYEADAYRDKVRYLLESTREEAMAEIAKVDADYDAKVRELDGMVEFIFRANEPTVLESGGLDRIADIAANMYIDDDGSQRPFLLDDEAVALQVLRGSLTEAERREIENHVRYTKTFLQKIPWGNAFRSVPIIAGAHHEKLDGSGYPDGLAAADIPVPARMMTISDIFDALTASDRPYKKAVPTEKALDILAAEVKLGRLDDELFSLFIDAKVYRQAFL